MIKVCGVNKEFRQKAILKDIELEIDANSIMGIIGENGAGKTSLFKIITGLVLPTTGAIYYDGVKLNDRNIRDIYRKTAVVLDGGRSLQWKLSVKDNFLYYATLKGVDKNKIEKNIDIYVEAFHIEGLLNQKVEELSLGQKQITAIVCSLISDTEYLFLDEPTNGLDLSMKNSLVNILEKIRKQNNCTIIIATHDLEFLLRIADKCTVLDGGKIIKVVNLKKEDFRGSYKYYRESFGFNSEESDEGVQCSKAI